MSRHTHPYVNPLDRPAEGAVPTQRQVNARAALAKPKDEPGVLWDPFREGPEAP